MFVIDRFENDWVVVEYNRKTFNLPRSLFPKDAKEGDVVEIKIRINKKETVKRKKSIESLADSLFED